MPLTRLLLIDLHQGFRESARKYLLRSRLFRSVETAASYNEGMLLAKEHFPDLLLVDSKTFFDNPGIIKEIEKLKHSNSALEVLVLFLFREEDLSRCQELLPMVSGIILKERFAEDLLEYLAAGKINTAGYRESSRKGVDQCN